MGQSTLPQYIPRCWEALRATLAKLTTGNFVSEVVDVLTTGDINDGLGDQQGYYLSATLCTHKCAKSGIWWALND